MSISTLVVKGTTGPLHRAILRLVPEWTAREGLPEILCVSTAGPGTGSLVVVTEGRLCRFLADELRRRMTDPRDPVWLRQTDDSIMAISNAWDPPTSLEAREL